MFIGRHYDFMSLRRNGYLTNEYIKSMDPVILLSFINTRLRDEYSSLNLLCSDLDLDEEILKNKLHDIDYEYNKDINQFK